MDKEISIVGEPTINPAMCNFIVDRPVYCGNSAYFGNRESAGLSPLARKIFELAEVESVLIADNRVTVTKSGGEPWHEFGKKIGDKIRGHIAANEPAVSEEYEKSLPDESALRQKVQDLLDGEINPALGNHGGWAELVEVKRNSIYLRLGGGCQGCASAKITLKMGIERIIRERIPEIGEVLDATDHASGINPYHQ
ncbi:MAG TPA: NifU family protein [Acidobacteriota bacterium]|nr:NifU family protein [Acidobacteriota bacterium]